jgi:hypothetical protein
MEACVAGDFGTALCERWIGFSEDDAKTTRRRREIFLRIARQGLLYEI